MLELPGAPPEPNQDYVYVRILGVERQLGDPGEGCGENGNEVIWVEPYVSVELCPETCALFMDAGQALLGVGAPACD